MADDLMEKALRARGLKVIAGVDEAGRGPLAGPVSAAAVILPEGYEGEGLNDSKKLSARKRDEWFERLTGDAAVRWAHVFVEAEEIDRLNILRATHVAMERAVAGLGVEVDYCLIDGLPVRGFRWEHEGVVKGDGKSWSIAAASVVAKVMRDRRMKAMDEEFPQYGFGRHMGYGTRVHLEALRKYGPCRIHRQSFQPVAQRSLSFD